MLKCCDYSFYLRVETILLELLAGKFIVRIIQSLKCGISDVNVSPGMAFFPDS